MRSPASDSSKALKRHPESEVQYLRLRVFSGVRWTAGGQLATQFIGFGVNVVLARLLMPADFGLLAMSLVGVELLDIFKTMGTRTAVIREKEVSNELLSSIFFLNCFLGLFLTGFVAIGAPLLGWLYGDPRVSEILRVLSVMFIISSLGVVPGALLHRDMRFNRLAAVAWADALTNGFVVIVLAFRGWGVWALVAAVIARSVSSVVLFWVFSGWRPWFYFRWSEIRKVHRFGLYLTGQQVFNLLIRNAHNLIIGRFLGPTPLGYYSMAFRLYRFPVQAISGVIRTVLFPALSRVQDDNLKIRTAYLRACGAISLVALPLMGGMWALATPFVYVVFGSKWVPMIPLLIILAPVGFLNSILATVGVLYTVKGRTDWLFYWEIVLGTAIVLSCFLGLPWGILGVATGFAITTILLAYPSFAIPFHLIDLRLPELFSALRSYMVATAIMVPIVLTSRLILERYGLDHIPVLLASAGLGGVVYVTLIFLTKPPAAEDFQRLLFLRSVTTNTL